MTDYSPKIAEARLYREFGEPRAGRTKYMIGFLLKNGRPFALERETGNIWVGAEPPLLLSAAVEEYPPSRSRHSGLNKTHAPELTVGHAAWKITPRSLDEFEDFLSWYAGASTARKGPGAHTQLPEQTPMPRRPVKSVTNKILYGPPGTGKTYRTSQEAVQICDGRLPAPVDGETQRDAVMRRYKELTKERRIEFVTFHQSFSYEDFVEGLRPETQEGSDGTGFRLTPRAGVFKEIAKRALEMGATGFVFPEDQRPRVFKMSLGRANFQDDAYLFDECLEGGYVLLGWGGKIDWSPPQFDKYEAIKERWQQDEPGAHGNNPNIAQIYALRGAMSTGDLVVVSNGNLSFRAVGRITGPYEFVEREDGYAHKRPIEWLWHDNGGGLPVDDLYEYRFSQQSAYRLKDEAINWRALEALVAKGRDQNADLLPHVLIIDEINRGNVSKILGELITLLEPDKRIGAEQELQVRLPYSGEKFGVPANLHVIGTMNTADRSIALLDTALRRRFTFTELQPDPTCVPEEIEGVALRRVFETLNARIEELFDRDHTIGHAYFMKCSTRAEVDDAMRYRVIPLLSEYFYEDWEKIRLVLGEDKDAEHGSFIERTELNSLATHHEAEPRYRYSVRETFSVNAYSQLGG